MEFKLFEFVIDRALATAYKLDHNGINKIINIIYCFTFLYKYTSRFRKKKTNKLILKKEF